MFWKPRSRINGFPLVVVDVGVSPYFRMSIPESVNDSPLVVVGVRGADGRLRTSPTLVEGVIPHHIGFRIIYVFAHLCVHSCICLLVK